MIETQKYVTMKALTHLSTLCMICIFLASCDGHEELYFTQTRVIGDGPCLTGAPRKEVPLPDNTLTLVLGSSDCVNIQGGSGNYTATSDRLGVELEINPNVSNQIVVRGTMITSQACITVTDDEGNSGSFIVEVYKDYIYDVDETTHRSVICRVEGVSTTDSAAIASDAIQNNQDARFIIRNVDLDWKPTSRSADDKFNMDLIVETYPITIQNSKQETILKGRFYPIWHQRLFEDNWWTWMLNITSIDEAYIKDEYDYNIDYYYVDNEEGKWLVKDLTYEYNKQYKEATSVHLWLPIIYSEE